VKQRERGYNQSTLIARGFSRVAGIPVVDGAIVRRRYTLSQTTLTKAERLQNVRDAFCMKASSQDDWFDKTFVLVDDVITTGATLHSCAAVLKACGAKPVIACSVALAE
jgi:ComF family protein